jgi:uncharacterized membrane protein YfcA
MSVKTVAPMVTFLGLVSSWMILRKDHGHVTWRALWPVLPWCAIGVAIGIYFFTTLDSRTLARALGVFAILYGAHSMWRTVQPAAERARSVAVLAPVAGSVGGFVGALFGASAGMFFAMYLDALRFPKVEFRATVAAILFGLGIMRGSGYVWAGAYDRQALIVCAAALPIMAVGVWAGNHIHANLDQLKFKRLVAAILILSGIPLLVR